MRDGSLLKSDTMPTDRHMNPPPPTGSGNSQSGEDKPVGVGVLSTAGDALQEEGVREHEDMILNIEWEDKANALLDHIRVLEQQTLVEEVDRMRAQGDPSWFAVRFLAEAVQKLQERDG
jgi:hypothetical protein